MTTEEYIKTITVCGQEVQVGMDDYGQCFFLEWTDAEGTHEESLGTYCLDYISPIYYLFDKEYKKLFRKDLLGDPMTDEEAAKYNEYQELFRKELSNEN